jgi:hypothetical protein
LARERSRVCDMVAGDLDRPHVKGGEEGASEGDFGHLGGEAVKDFEVQMGIQADDCDVAYIYVVCSVTNENWDQAKGF